MDKKDITLFSKKIIDTLLNNYGSYFSNEMKDYLLEYYDTLDKSSEFDESQMHNIDFLFLSTSFLMNEGLVHSKRLEELLNKSIIPEELLESIYDDETKETELVFNTSNGPLPAKNLFRKELEDDIFPVQLRTNIITKDESENNLNGFVNLVDSLYDKDEPYNIVMDAISSFTNYYNDRLIDKVDQIDEDMISEFLSVLESLYDNDLYESNLDEYQDGFDYDTKEQQLDSINEEFIDRYNINLFRILKKFVIKNINNYIKEEDLYEETNKLYQESPSDIEGRKELDKQTIDNYRELNSEVILKNGTIDPTKLILYTRNALAHNNYEFIGQDRIRLYRKVVLDNGRVIDPKDLSEEELSKYGEQTIFDATMSLDFLKKISDNIEQVCHDEYQKIRENHEIVTPITLNFIYDEIFNKNHQKNEIYTGDYNKFESNKDLYSFSFLILSLLNANLMVLHNIDLNQGKNDLNFNNMKLDDNAKLGYIEKLITITENKISSLRSEKRNLTQKSNNTPTLAQKNKELLIAYLKGTKSKKFRKSFKSTEIIQAIRSLKIKELTIENIDKIINELEDKRFDTSVLEENGKFKTNVNMKVKNDVDMLNKIKKILETDQLDTTELENYLDTLKLAKANFLVGNTEALKPFEVGEEYTKYILRHTRISLAHGTAKFKKDRKTGEPYVNFVNYDRKDKTIVIFDGRIKLDDLLKAITNKEHLNYLMKDYLEETGPVLKK